MFTRLSLLIAVLLLGSGQTWVTPPPQPISHFTCFVQAVTVTTQCQASPIAGLRIYVRSISYSNQVATAQSLDIVFGTGVNCATGITPLTHKQTLGTLATTTSPFGPVIYYDPPLVSNPGTALCIRPSAATAFGATMTGFIAP